MNYDSLPNDPVMLMSFLNTQRRDHYPSLEPKLMNFRLKMSSQN